MSAQQRIRYRFDLPGRVANDPRHQLRFRGFPAVRCDVSRRRVAASRTDPARNAMALLNSYTTLLPAAPERSREELKPLFHAWRNRENFPI